MWFQLPEGCGGITVERQEFMPEFRNDKGTAYFRAPDHFAPRILALKGFVAVQQPEGAPEDLPKEDPARDGAIEELTRNLEAQRIEVQNLRSDLAAAVSRISAMTNERTDLNTTLAKALARVAELEEELEDRPTVEGKKK